MSVILDGIIEVTSLQKELDGQQSKLNWIKIEIYLKYYKLNYQFAETVIAS